MEHYNIYYAHHQWKYGTKIEEYELDLIRKRFPNAKIFNPSVDLAIDGLSEKEIMDKCIETVKNSDFVIFSSMDGMVGKGVYTEIKTAQEKDKLVLYLFQDTFTTEYSMILHRDNNGHIKSDRTYALVEYR